MPTSPVSLQLFHLFTVKRIPAERTAPQRVQFADFYVQAESLDAAAARISEMEGVAESAQVWGAQVEHAVVLTPLSRLHQQATLEDHARWARQQSTYIALKGCAAARAAA